MPTARFRSLRPSSIRRLVQWLVLAAVGPSWLLAVGVSWQSYQRERASLIERTVQQTGAINQSVEAELANSIVALQALATSSHIDEGDARRFHEQARELLRLGRGDNILWVDAQLNVRSSLAQPVGAPLPPMKHDRFPDVMRTGRPEVADLFVGQVSKRPQVAVAVPVMRDGRAVGRLEMVFTPERIGEILTRQHFPEGWTAVVLDSRGVIVARTRDPARFVGRPARQALLDDLRQRGQGSHHGLTSDGIPVISCFSRSATTGWAVAIGVPETALRAELRQTLVVYSLGSLALLAVGLLLAGRIGRRIAQPIQALVAPAIAIGRGEAAEIAPTRLTETAELAAALQQAQVLLQQRDDARRVAEAAQRESQQRLHATLDASRIGDWDLDLQSGQVTRSARHDQCFGYSEPRAEWTGDDFFRALHPDDRDAVTANMAQVLKTGGAWQQDARVIWPDGSVHWLATQGVCVMENGVARRLLGTVTDITERQRNEELRVQGIRLEAENQQMKEASRLKSEFLANMSHELRTPLNAIIGFADLLRLGSVPAGSPKQAEFLGHIASSGQHLLGLINDVLDLAKVEAGKIELFPAPLALPQLMQEVVDLFGPEASRRQIELRVDASAAPAEVVLDGARLKQIIYNFVSNAIKFSHVGGRVVLRALGQVGAEGADQVRIEVQDEGIGIAADDQSRLFSPFQQIHAGGARAQTGTGLGLSLSRRLAEVMGGRVGVDSEAGRGSTFFVVLPRVAAADADRRPPTGDR